MERDSKFFESRFKTYYILEVKQEYKGTLQIFELLKIQKVCSNHLIGKVTRNNFLELVEIYSSNPSLFEPYIIQEREYYYIGRYSGNYFYKDKMINKKSTLSHRYLENLRNQRRDLDRIQRTQSNNYQVIDYTNFNNLFYKVKELEDDYLSNIDYENLYKLF